MRSPAADLITALVVPAVAALGGALVVFSAFDDAPGGTLIGLVLIAGSVGLSLWAKRRRT